jgi:tetratricopeptide (TPR) repeat protein
LKQLLYGSLFRIGDQLDNMKLPKEAQQQYEAALKIAEELVHRTPSDSDRQLDLAFIHEKVGDVKAQADLPGALKHYKAALDIEKANIQHDESNLVWRDRLSATRVRIRQVLAQQGNFDDALGEFRSAESIREKLAQVDPTPSRQYLLAVTCHRIGTTYLKTDKLPDALGLFKRAFDIIDKLTTDDKNNSRYADLHATSYYNIGDVAVANKDWDVATDNYAKAVRILQELYNNDPKNAERKSRLDGVQKKLAAVPRAKTENTTQQ